MAHTAKAEQLQNAQQWYQAGQLEIQQRQQALKDRQAITRAMLNWDPSQGYDALAHSVLKNGGSANAATAIQRHGFEVRKTASDITKTDEEARTERLENLAKRHDLLAALSQCSGPRSGRWTWPASGRCDTQAQKDGLIDPRPRAASCAVLSIAAKPIATSAVVLEKACAANPCNLNRQ